MRNSSSTTPSPSASEGVHGDDAPRVHAARTSQSTTAATSTPATIELTPIDFTTMSPRYMNVSFGFTAT